MKCINQINEVLTKFFQKSRTWFVKLLGAIETIQKEYNRKKHDQHIVSIQRVY